MNNANLLIINNTQIILLRLLYVESGNHGNKDTPQSTLKIFTFVPTGLIENS
jgi:hypothetical protein